MANPARNAPCPCGSGKKYKKCCLSKDETQAQERELDAEFQQALLMAIGNMRQRALEKKPHIKEYKTIRKLHGEIGRGMMEYYWDGKFEHTVDPDYTSPCAKEGRDDPKPRDVVFYESEFDHDTREGMQGLAETVIYKTAPNVSCITEEFIRKNRYRKPEKLEMLQSMLNSQAGLFEITDIDSDEGYAFLREVFTGQEYKITDTGLSGNKNFSETYIYTRIITYQGVSFGTGLSLMYRKTDPFIISFMKREKKDYMPHAEYIRFIELYNQFSRNPEEYTIVPHSF